MPRITLKFIHERKVRSLAKKTLGSTRTGRAIFLEGADARRGWDDIVAGLGKNVGGHELRYALLIDVGRLVSQLVSV